MNPPQAERLQPLREDPAKPQTPQSGQSPPGGSVGIAPPPKRPLGLGSLSQTSRFSQPKRHFKGHGLAAEGIFSSRSAFFSAASSGGAAHSSPAVGLERGKLLSMDVLNPTAGLNGPRLPAAYLSPALGRNWDPSQFCQVPRRKISSKPLIPKGKKPLRFGAVNHSHSLY